MQNIAGVTYLVSYCNLYVKGFVFFLYFHPNGVNAT
ncbi:hypothetical protein PSDI105340_16505 [Pseudoalteromonas distincta]